MSNLTRRNTYILPGICSIIIPGLGQLFKGQIGKAISFFLMVGILGWLGNYSTLIWIGSGIVWLVNVLDAFFNSKQ